MGIESLTAVEAFLIALSGMVIIFMMLGCLAGLITIISKVVQSIEQTNKPAEQVAVAQTPTTSTAPAPKRTGEETYGGEIQLIDVDERTAVCIMAIVSDETGIDLSELVFKKIRAL